MKKNIAVVGCGDVSEIYLSNLANLFDNVNVYGVCDIDEVRAREKADKYNAKLMSLDEILKDENVDIVLNITTPHAHYEICKKAILAKKNVYVEKPISLTYTQGKELIDLAEKNRVLIGCAPDTFMGAGLHTARKIIDDGLIGDIVGAAAFMVRPGHESWHPTPEVYYKYGAGPMLDMGVYYITALVNLVGKVKSVSAMASCLQKQRKITSQPKYGQIFDVEVDTHINALLKFENGAIGNVITSFDVIGSSLPKIEIYGTKGSLIVPDPNEFDGEVKIKQSFDKEFHTFPLINRYSQNSRGLGASDMAQCLINNSDNNCASGKRALHVLEIMEKILLSSQMRQEIDLESEFERPGISPLCL